VNNRTTQADIHASARTAINGLQSWSARGLAGRGVLIDYASYAKRHRIDVHHFSGHAITLETVLKVIKEQGVDLLPGDVLFLRTGYVAAYKELDKAGRERVAGVREWCGLGQSRETTEWLWQKQFAAVASDSPGFEVRRTCNRFIGIDHVWLLSVFLLLTSNSTHGERMASSPHFARWLGHTSGRIVRP
jgi:hypothetical protein